MNFAAVFDYYKLFVNGFLLTLQLAIMATVSGTVVGVIVAIFQTGRIKAVKPFLRIYVELFRGSPLMIQLFMIYFCLPKFGINVSMASAVFLSFTLYSGAYIAEIIRSGIESVPLGQWEAAVSLGISYPKVLSKVIFPQTIKAALAPLIGFYLGLIKDTSLASTIGYVELVRTAKNVMNITGTPCEAYIVVAICFFAICWPLSKLVQFVERRQVLQ